MWNVSYETLFIFSDQPSVLQKCLFGCKFPSSSLFLRNEFVTHIILRLEDDFENPNSHISSLLTIKSHDNKIFSKMAVTSLKNSFFLTACQNSARLAGMGPRFPFCRPSCLDPAFHEVGSAFLLENRSSYAISRARPPSGPALTSSPTPLCLLCLFMLEKAGLNAWETVVLSWTWLDM